MSTSSQVIIQEAVGAPFQLVDVEFPNPTGYQVLVAIRSTGVCQSQIFWSKQDRNEPMLFGHEALGTVTATGELVTGLDIGQLVMVTWVPRKSERTPETGTAVLSDGRIAKSPNIYTWGRHILADELYVVPVGQSANRDVTAVVACAVLTGAGAVTRTADVQPGQSVAVVGLGGVGLSAVSAARQRGASQVIAIDLSSEKTEFAQHFGATDGINARVDNVTERILELTGGVDWVIDCVSNEITIGQGLAALRPGKSGVRRGGSLVMVGIPEKPFSITARPMILGEFGLLGSLGGSSHQEDIHEYLDWSQNGHLDLETLITNRYGLKEAEQALNDLAEGRVLGRSILVIDGSVGN